MFHTFIPLIPLSVAGAIFLKRRVFAYGLPVLLLLLKVALTQPSLIYVFMGAALLLAVFLVRKFRLQGGASLWTLAGVSFLAVLLFEGISNMGVWILGGNCTGEGALLYAYDVEGLVQCYRAALPYAASHLLRDMPLTVIAVSGIAFVRKFASAKLASSAGMTASENKV